MSLTSAAIVAAIAFLAPLAIRFTRARLPSIVLEIVLGICIGPQVLGWATVDQPVAVLALIGLAFLLLLAGLEIDFEHLRGRLLGVTSAGFALSFVLAVGVGRLLYAQDLVRSPLLIAVILSATSLGIILPALVDAGQSRTAFGQLVIAGGSIAEVVPVVLLSVLFSAASGGTWSQVALLAAFLGLAVALGLAIVGLERSTWISQTLLSLQETTAEIRVRGAFVLLLVFASVAARFGLEAILGAFLAGAALKLVDRDTTMTHTLLRPKLQAVGFGVFIPFFFVSTGMQLDVLSLLTDASVLARVPIFLLAILVVRAAPAVVVYQACTPDRLQLVAAGLLQATSLSIPVVAGQIGVDLGLIRAENYVALVAAGLLSVVLFPVLALSLVRRA